MLNYSMQNMLKLLLNYQVLYQQKGLKTELECPEMLMVSVSSFLHQKKYFKNMQISNLSILLSSILL